MKRKRKTNGFKVCHCGLQQAYEDMRDRVLELEDALKHMVEAEEATIEDFNAKEIDGLESAMNHARRVLESQREAAESADEKPDGQAENVDVDATADGKTPTKKSNV
jgi:hypothetical protein